MPGSSNIRTGREEFYSLPELMDMGIDAALEACADMKVVSQRMQVLQRLGLGYLTLGEETPGLSGGEAQRLKAGQRNGENAGGFRVRFRRTDHRAASAGCAGIAGRFPGLD